MYSIGMAYSTAIPETNIIFIIGALNNPSGDRNSDLGGPSGDVLVKSVWKMST